MTPELDQEDHGIMLRIIRRERSDVYRFEKVSHTVSSFTTVLEWKLLLLIGFLPTRHLRFNGERFYLLTHHRPFIFTLPSNET